MRMLVVALVLLGTSQPTLADTDTDNQVWTAVLGNAKLGDQSSGLSLWLDTHLRRGDAGTVHIARPGIGWRLNPSLSVWAGYAWVPVFTDGADAVHEHRAWQQLILKTKLDSGLALQSRTRFEQRFSGAGDDTAFRIREFVRVGHPLRGPFGLVAWDELFIGLNDVDWGASAGFDQNRLFLGGSAKIAGGLRVEMGYLFVYLNREPNNIVAHVLATNLFVAL